MAAVKSILLLALIACVVLETTLALSSGRCLDSSRVTSCSPKCTDDSNCLGAKICCQNICGHKSCSDQNQYGSGSGGDKYSNSKSGSKSGGSGSYCGNTKCGSNEKCELDRATKRDKCVRA